MEATWAVEQLNGPIKSEGLVVSDLADWVMLIRRELAAKQMFKGEKETCWELRGTGGSSNRTKISLIF